METVYSKLLKYYLNTENYFLLFAEHFWGNFNHTGKCYKGKSVILTEETYRGLDTLHFESEIYRKYNNKLNDSHGYKLKLSETVIKEYFNKNFSEEQLFSVFFAHWIELSDPQLKQIADIRNKSRTWFLLDFFLCNPCYQKHIYANECMEDYKNKITYFVEDTPATYINGTLVTKKPNNEYTII